MNPYYGNQSWGYAPAPAAYPYAQTPSQSYADVAPGTAAYGSYGYGYPPAPPPAAAAYSLPPGYTAAASQQRESAPVTTVSTAEYVRWYNENFGSQPAPSAYG